MFNKDELKNIVDDLDTSLNELMRNLISVTLVEKYKSGGNKSTRRDQIQRYMDQYLLDHKD
jgi:hypothetical protein